MRFATSLLAATILGGMTAPLAGAAPVANGGPWNAAVMQGGIGIARDVPADAPVLAARAPTGFAAWVRPQAVQPGSVVLLAIGDTAGGVSRALLLVDGKPALRVGGATLVAPRALAAGRFTHLAASWNGSEGVIYVDGQEVARSAVPDAGALAPRLAVAPALPGLGHFGGDLVDARIEDGALPAPAVQALVAAKPDFDLVQMWHVGVGWEFQKTANTGYWRQQDPWTLPQAKGGFSAPVAKPAPTAPAVQPLAEGLWRINGWQLAGAPDVPGADGAALSQPGNPKGLWRAATVPGTVLTTLVDRGVYPDPYYGLNNMRIPESLARQDWWYRTSFTVPADAAGKRLALRFNGINYAAEIWVNGKKLGQTKGAFARGEFTLVPVAGENVIAVKVSPPPHPGIPHEQSIAAGVGENGGQLAIDGPTFVATEGWDWIPGIRDRDTGLWQDVQLAARGDVRLLDSQVVTDLPLPRTDSADVLITVPLRNDADAPRTVTVRAAFDNVTVERTITLTPGEGEVRFTPADFPQLHVKNPKLWWPNGYGEQALHPLHLTATVDGAVSDRAETRFGIREVSYDLSLMDHAGALRRVNVQPTDGRLAGQKLIDVRHEAIKETPRGWVESLTAAGETSPAVQPLGAADTLPEPHLTIRVNGVKIAARGGSWGMDDAMKRVSRARMEPAFRLHKEAHLNIIRNWMGTSTEPEFYDLADEYGMMVLNDFWQSTQNFQVEPQDPQLFLANAEDVVKRYRNHPSIIIWFGRNEGVPYPTLNEGLDDLLFKLDGTRWYTGSSNTVNLQGSGPYNYRQPEGYFTDLATGFSVETGTPSLATAAAIAQYVPEADRWPLSDTLAYHDWHFSGNGDTKTFMASLDRRFGAATSFADFERKAQMMNLETHQAMIEGFLGHLWTKNSGRLFWMTHPAWPSNAWQIYSSDFDTHAAYYGAQRAARPLHAQLNLPDNALVLVNTTQQDARGLTVASTVTDLAGKVLFTRTDRTDALANRDTTLKALPLDAIFARDPMVLVSLKITDRSGKAVNDTVYWRGKDEAAYRALNAMAPAPLGLAAASTSAEGGERQATITLTNHGSTPALNARATLVDAAGQRILPAYYSDNYVAVMPGETRTITVRWPATAGTAAAVMLEGWNVPAARAGLAQ
ncbi:glycosyl hydrolase [Novosphingobium pokkalii]|nr:glycosyl hydrolase [Novosphingobium pokkalii]